MNDTTLLPDRTPQRVRHTLRFRELTVQAVQRVTPHLVHREFTEAQRVAHALRRAVGDECGAAHG